MPLRYGTLPSEIDRWIRYRPPLHLFVLPDARRGGSVGRCRRYHVRRRRRGADRLRFNTGVAQHYFCSRCGIYTHHRRRSNPNQYGVNVACLKGVSPFDFADVPVIDGVNHGSGYEIIGHLRFIRTEDLSAAGGD
jgi:hypothetical protein